MTRRLRLNSCAVESAVAPALFLILLKVERNPSCYVTRMMKTCAETLDPTPCAVCARPMHRVRTIWRAFQDDLEHWECSRCGVSVTQTLRASKMMPADPVSRLTH